jgi:hypothetical protein
VYLIGGNCFCQVSGHIWIHSLEHSQLVCNQLKRERRRCRGVTQGNNNQKKAYIRSKNYGMRKVCYLQGQYCDQGGERTVTGDDDGVCVDAPRKHRVIGNDVHPGPSCFYLVNENVINNILEGKTLIQIAAPQHAPLRLPCACASRARRQESK